MPTQPTLTSSDISRLKTQAQRLFHFMSTNPGWYTLKELAVEAKASEAGVSARLRDFRKPEWGNHDVDRTLATKSCESCPVYHYFLTPNGPLLDGKRTVPTAKMQARERIEQWIELHPNRAFVNNEGYGTPGMRMLVSDIREILK
jgi:hypothetical protein